MYILHVRTLIFCTHFYTYILFTILTKAKKITFFFLSQKKKKKENPSQIIQSIYTQYTTMYHTEKFFLKYSHFK